MGDSAYGGGETRAALRAGGHVQTIKPLPLASATPGGFTVHDFGIDQQAGTARCPAGATAKDGRTIRVHPHDDELRAARRRATTHGFQQS